MQPLVIIKWFKERVKPTVKDWLARSKNAAKLLILQGKAVMLCPSSVYG
jgi:hypothetical protein